MHQVPFQAMLFEIPDADPDHFHYASSNSATVKFGMARSNPDRAMAEIMAVRMKKDGQFKGHHLIFTRPASPDCEIHRVNNKSVCDWELQMASAYGSDRLPSSEHYRPSSDVIRGLRFMTGRDRKASAIVDWIERESLRRTA